MNREQRPDPGKKQPKPGSAQRHLDLAWSSPAIPWETQEPLAAPEGATVPAVEWADPWPPIRSASDEQDEHADAGIPDEQTDAPAEEDGEPGAEPEDRASGEGAEATDEEQPVEDAEAEGYLESDFDDLAELDEIAFPSQGLPRSTWVLAVAALAAVAFGGGILVQKHHDSGLVSPAALAAAQLQQASIAGASGPALTGTVVAVSPTEFTVKDAQGIQHKVAVTDATPIVKKLSLKDATNGSSQGLTNGSQVIVQGTSDADGTLQASAVVVS